MEEKVYEYDPVTSSAKILNEIKYILETNKNVDDNSNYIPVTLDETCISIANVYSCIVNEKYRFETTEKLFKQLINESIKKHFGDNSSVVFYGLNFDKDEISIGFRKDTYNYNYDYQEIVFAKYNEDIYLKSSKSTYDKEIFRILYEIISNAYNELIKFKSYDKETSYNIKSMNSNFIINISHFGISLCSSKDFCPDFKLEKTSYDNVYTCECNSGIVLNNVKGIEDEIFKNTFVRIEDCPSWMRTSLYEMRKQELEEQKQTKTKIITNKEKTLETIPEEKTNKKSKFLSLFKKSKK
jgi:hypothetical protein